MASILLQVAVSAALSFVARLLQPAQEGPRLQDLKLHGSSYGVMNPLLWGTMRVPGNVIDETDLVEHQHSSDGKGGTAVNTYTYTVSVAIRVTDVEVAGFSKIWANGRLIYGPGANADKAPPVTFYLGTEDQLPDPTFEAIHGVGNVPGYRGVAYAVFTDWELTEFGNTLPNLNFEVYTKLLGTIPSQVSTVSGGTGTVHGATYDPLTGYVTHGNYSGANYIETVWDLLTGALISTTTTACDPIIDPDSGSFSPSAISNPTEDVQTAALGHSGPGTQMQWYHKAVGTFLPTPSAAGGFGLHYNLKGLAQDGFIYSIDQPTSFFSTALQKWPTDDGAVTGDPVASQAGIFQGDAANTWFGSSDTGDVFLYYQGNIGSDPLIQQFAGSDLELIKTWTAADLPNWGQVGGPFVIYNGLIVVTRASGFASQTVVVYDFATLSSSSVPIGTLVIGGSSSHGLVRLYNGYAIVDNGFISLDRHPGPVRLSDIVADLSRRAGLADGEIDVSALTDLVDGYLVTQQAPARTMLQPLRDTYFFDAVESDDVVKFVKRGGKSVFTIPDDDLAAHVDSEAVPPILATTRTQDVDVPAVVNVSYVNPDADYQTGNQVARRMVTNSQSEVTIQLPVSLRDLHAKGIADAHLYEAEIERQRYSLQTSRKYAKYEPTDIGTARGQDIVIRQKQEVRSGVIKFDGVSVLGSVYTLGGGGVATQGHTTTTTLPSSTSSALLLDLPLVNDADTPSGFYAAMYGTTPWPGESLMKSSDGGSTYTQVASTTVPAVNGTASNALPNFFGGNVFDEASVLRVVLQPGQALSSVTAVAVLNGANPALIGSEVFQFKNAELVATDTFDLSGLLRGRLGTEWAMPGHGVNERFVLLPVPRAPLPVAELNLVRLYKPVTAGGTLIGTPPQSFTDTGVSLKPYAPVLLGGGTDAAGNVTLNGTLRTRTGGAWLPFTDVVQADGTDCVFQIWNADYTQCARIIETTVPTTVYTSAQQVTDFGANQQTIFFTLGQKGSIGLGYQARGTAVGAGGSNNDPLAPISPYQSATSGSSSPPPVPDSLTLSMGWANIRKLSSSVGTFNCSNILVCSFTTPAGTANGVIGWIAAVEWIDAAVGRVATLSTAPGDFSGTALSRVVSPDPTCFFSVGTNPDGYPQLATNTTYYFNVQNSDGAGACTCLSGSCGVAVELTKPSGL